MRKKATAAQVKKTETGLDANSRDFLEAAIQDYNTLFGTSFDTSADKFKNYYKDTM